MSSKIAISVIGAGNVGYNLARELAKKDFTISEIYSRNIQQANSAAKDAEDAQPTDSLDFSKSKSQVFIISVSDDAIEGIAKAIILPENAILAHTAGSVPLQILQAANTSHTGIFYPLQSLSKGHSVAFDSIPILIEAANSYVKEILMEIATTISPFVYPVDSQERARIHLAATILNNFTNHLLSLAFDQIKTTRHDPKILYPLLQNTVRKAIEQNPDRSQTGPAIRRDKGTIHTHLELMSEDEDLTDLYKMFTRQIQRRYAE